MTTFIDGMAKNTILSLQRAPVFLRVTMRFEQGKPVFDALDQLDDTPTPEETLFAYQVSGAVGGAFIDGRDAKTGKRFGRYEPIATYRLHHTQPADEIMRDNKKWGDWVLTQASETEVPL